MTTAESIATPQLIARECRQLVLSQGRAGAAATIGVATLFLLALRDVHPRQQLIGWAIAVAVISMLRVALAGWAKRSTPEAGDVQPNTPLICIIVGVLSGGVWGAAATMLFPLGHSELYFVTAFLLIGMPAGAISSFGAWWPAYAAYVLASVGPFAVYFLATGHSEFVIAGLAACLFGAFLLREGHVIGRTISRNIAQRIALMAMTKTLGDALDRADAANRAKSAFLANMRHELRTPLNVILGMSELLVESPGAPEHRALPHEIRRAGQSLLALIDDVLDLSQIEAGRISLRPAPFAPRRLVDDVIEMFALEAEAKSLRVDAVYAASMPERFVGDEARLRQVVLNLVGNAIKFTSAGSVRIEVSFDKVAAGAADEVVEDAPSMLRIEVADTGPGIAESEHARIFSAFQQGDESSTRAYPGTGLGLKISSELVALMGGRIEVRSVPGAGSVFAVTVPESILSAELAEVVAAESARRMPAPAIASISGLRVLVVEDNVVNASLIRLLLEREGCLVSDAASGVQALDMLRAYDWDVVLMDCQMPEMDGYAATRYWRRMELVERRPRLPILALTAHAMADDRKRCLDAGMDDYLTKPVKLDALRVVLSRYAPGIAVGSEPVPVESAAAGENGIREIDIATVVPEPTAT
jgi:two-component system, sensor histidine kinase